MIGKLRVFCLGALIFSSCTFQSDRLSFDHDDLILTYSYRSKVKCDWCPDFRTENRKLKIGCKKGQLSRLSEEYAFPFSKKPYKLSRTDDKIYIEHQSKTKLKKEVFFSLNKNDTILQVSLYYFDKDEPSTYDSHSLFESIKDVKIEGQKIPCFYFKMYTGRRTNKTLNTSVIHHVFLEKKSLIPVKVDTELRDIVTRKKREKMFVKVTLEKTSKGLLH